SIVWVKTDPLGAEYAAVNISREGLTASGTAIGSTPSGYRIEYRLDTGTNFVTKRLSVTAHGDGWRRRLDLTRLRSGRWICAGVQSDMKAVAGALDCDLALSPLTNTMPVLRHGLLEDGGPLEFLMAWVSVPDLHVYPSRQRYRFLRRSGQSSIVRYESMDSHFTAELTFDKDGLCLEYPGIGRSV
ncbi:MAG TPA: putative glycolipid-binding domain-containing protein, partial [Candidatus Dormibacteraeota bacterium]|nr:putative glycolipid-binding domain-containing protein [Candidatus Dormibacteraeota bacterium]